MSNPKYRRILLKMGGEALAGQGGFGIDPAQALFVANVVKEIRESGVQVAIVIGGGNFWRGAAGVELGMDEPTAHHIGMLATAMNALALRDALERVGVETRVQTAIEMKTVAEPYIRLRATRHLDKGRVVVFGAGTGNPYFTTDSAGALRAMEISADVLIKATKVDAVYDSDPNKNPDAKRFDQISYIGALNMKLRVMDSTAISLCMDNDMPIAVMNLWQDNSVLRFVLGESVGTMISDF